MKPIITPAESARLDQAASEPVEVLMERAGLAVAIAATRMGSGYGSRVIVLAGPGSNGGDGYVAARFLKERGAMVEVEAVAEPKQASAARRAARKAVDRGVPVRPLGGPRAADLIIDAVFGAGFHGIVPGEVAAWSEGGPPVLAVDLPSGLDGTTGEVGGAAFTADCTVTFHALKVGHVIGEGPDRSGKVEVVDIGLEGGEPELLLCEDEDAVVPERARDAHKWSAGSVAVVGGSEGIGGAALLAARSALEFGAGAVRLVCPGGLAGAYAAADPGVMTAPIGDARRLGPEDAAAVLEAVQRFDVVALGPGLGKGQGDLVAAVMEGCERPMVLDADGITAATVAGLSARRAATVVTPHAGEFERLSGEAASHLAAAELAAGTGSVILLKGSPTIVAGAPPWVVTSGGPELATIGTGDVLTGMVAALLARGLDPEAAARSAAHRHGLAGRALAARTSVTATALAGEIGRFAA